MHSKKQQKQHADIYKQATCNKDDLKIESIGKKKIQIYGKRIEPDNILGKHFKINQLKGQLPNITLGTCASEVPAFGQLKLHKPEEIKRPPTPDLIKKIRKQREEQKKLLEQDI